MKNMINNKYINDENYKKLNDMGFTYIGSGYMHLIFEKNKKIYKINKYDSKYYANYKSFLREKEALMFLETNGIPVPNIIDILDKGELIEDFPILIEEKASGKIYTRENISQDMIIEIFMMLEKIWNIEVAPGYLFNPELSSPSWISFLTSRCIEAEDSANIFSLPNYIDNIKKNLLENIYLKNGFMIMDVNEENFFFENKKIVSIIDIDHPIGGDLFYQWGAYEYFRPEQFTILKAMKKFTKEELLKIKHYALLQAYTDLFFRYKTTEDKMELKFWHDYSKSYILKVGKELGYE